MLNKILSFGRSKSTCIPALLFGVILTAVLVGCFGDFAPMAPSNDDVKVEQPNWLTYDVPDQPGAAKVVTASATIDPKIGGSVSGVDGGLTVTLDVLPQASWGKSVTITITFDGSGNVIIDFGPDGTLFAPAATLTVKGAKLKNGNAVSLYWWDSVAGVWVKLDTSVNIGPDGVITSSVSHFSRYGLADYSGTDGP